MRLDAAAIHSALVGSWPTVLEQLGIGEEFLRNRHGPCPACGGKDRFRFDDRDGRGTFFCNHCGAGDAFKLLELVHGWPFTEVMKRVVEVVGLRADDEAGLRRMRTVAQRKNLGARRPERAEPTRRVFELLQRSADPGSVDDVVAYLEGRRLWPLPADCALRAAPRVDYWEGRERIGAYPAMVAEVRDLEGELVTVHVTYLSGGRKLEPYESRKILSPMTGRRGCAVRLVPLKGAVLGVGEGLETCLAAHALHGVPVWSALNTSLLAKFEPPPGVRRLIIFADRDEPGRDAAAKLTARLRGRLILEPKFPPALTKDWADVLAMKRKSRSL